MSEQATQRLINKLHALVGPAGLLTDADAQAPYLTDWLGKWKGATPVVVRPANTAETAAVVRLCSETHTPIVTQGGNTGMSGGATPDASGAQVVLSTTRMSRVRAIDPINNTQTVDAGAHQLVTDHGGSISAEHGVGQLRRDELRLYKSPVEMELMLRIKQAMDPNHLMSPGKLL